MKKLNLSIVALAAFGAAGAAQAQSSVTLYGILDTSVAVVSNAGGTGTGKNRFYGVIDGVMSGDRWGMKGTEDLGGGLSAIFDLESGFNPNTGKSEQGSRLFGRQAWVGLSSKQYGTLTFGRQYDAVKDQVQALTGDNWSEMFSTPGDFDNNDNGTRINNAVKYLSPSFSGLTAEAEYGFGNVAGATGSGQSYSASLAYANGPLAAAAGYLQMDNGSAASRAGCVGSACWTSGVSSPGLGNGILNISTLNPYDYGSAGIFQGAVQYTIGQFSVSLAGSNAIYRPDGGTTAAAQSYNGVHVGTIVVNTGAVFATYQVTPAVALAGSYSYSRVNLGGAGTGSINQVGGGVTYNFSKRTALYAFATYQGASKGLLASVGDVGYVSTTRNQTIGAIGIDHSF
jgi:predicted porin